MKKRILAIMLVLPLLVAFTAMGFTKLVFIAIPQLPEDIRVEYAASEAFEFDDYGDSIELKAFIVPEAAEGTIEWTSSDESVATIEGNRITFLKEGMVTVTATEKFSGLSKSFSAMLLLSGDQPKYVKANLQYPTEKGETAIGLFDYKNSLSGEETSAHTEVIDFAVLPAKAPQNVSVKIVPECEYSVDGSQVKLSPTAEGDYSVTISAEGTEVSTSFEFKAVDGVNVYSYEDLLRATNKSEGRDFALRVNLESEANLGRANSVHCGYASGEAFDYATFDSTYDTRFLERMGKSKQLKAAVVLKANVYGNGHTINLHDFAFPSEVEPSTGIAIPGPNDVFAANPLEFVTAAGLTVFGQGNVGFLANANDITIDNVVLKNCNNVSDLSMLDYVGTVLEVMGDRVTIKNSTVQNGRTVVRSFSNKDLLIENCILAYAREFIFKQGSNKFVYPEEGKEWAEVKSQIFDFDKLPDEAKVADSTAVIRDTSFFTSGIFCIGMDTHFAGEYLYKWIGSNQSVNNLAATSYKSSLSLEGDVKFYDWKIPQNMDSSTLVSGSYTGIDVKLDIYDLLKKHDREYGDNELIKKYKGLEYVHGGIAFFGGGYNLSDVTYNGTSVKCDDNNPGLNNDMFISLKISLNDPKIFGDTFNIFALAAGTGNFSFCIYRSSYDGIPVGASPFTE